MRRHTLAGMRPITAAMVTFALVLGSVLSAHAQAPTIRVGYLPIFTQLPLFTAVEKGYFKEGGLNVELKSFAGGAPLLEALAGGSIDIAGAANVISLFQAREQGFDFVVVLGDAGIAKKLPDIQVNMVRKDSGINTLKDLEGKRFGIPNLGNINWLYNMEYLSRNGVDTSKISWVEIGIPRAPTALLTRQVDIATTVEPFTTVLLDSGEARPVYSELVELAPGGLISVLVARGAWAKANMKALTQWAQTIRRANDYNHANQAEARLRLTRFSRIEAALANRITWPVWKQSVEDRDLQIPMELAVKYSVVKAALPIDQFVLSTARAR